MNAFVSGGMLKTAAPAMIGKKLDGITHICDFYATWASLAGVPKEDTRAAAAKLPPVDGVVRRTRSAPANRCPSCRSHVLINAVW